MRAELLDGLATVGGFGDQGHVRLNSHETGDPLAHEWMVVDREDPNWRAAAAHDVVPLACADAFEANTRDSHERLGGFA